MHARRTIISILLIVLFGLTCSAQRGRSYNPLCLEMQAYANGASTRPSCQVICVLNYYIQTLKNDGNWMFDGLWILGVDATSTAIVNAALPYQACQINNAMPFTPYQGFKGDGATQYLSTLLQIDSLKHTTATNFSAGVWVRQANTAPNGVEMGTAPAAGVGFVIAYNFSTYHKLVEMSDANVTGINNTDLGLEVGYRNNSTQNSILQNGTNILTSTAASSAFSTSNIINIFQYATATGDLSNAQLSLAFIGPATINQTKFNAATQTLAWQLNW